MSWLFSRALVEAYSEANCSDGEPSAQLNVMPSPRPFWRNDKTIDVLNRSPFGLTWKRLTADLGEALLTWFRAGFPAPISPAPATERESKARKADCGSTWRESFAKWDRGTSSWRTAQCLLLGGLEEFSGTWPRWGSMRNGACFRRQTPSGLSAFREVITQCLTISARECGSSQRILTPHGQSNNQGQQGGEFEKAVRVLTQRAPTAKATEAGPDFAKEDRSSTGISLQTFVAKTQRAPSHLAGDASGSRSSKGKDRPDEFGLAGFVKRAPTARCEDSQCAGGHRGQPDTLVAFTRQPTLTVQDAEQAGGMGAVERKTRGLSLHNRLASPAARDFRSGAGRKENGHTPQLCEQVGGQLNPQWEDWFMGFPIGLTDVRHSAMHRFRQWSDSHGES